MHAAESDNDSGSPFQPFRRVTRFQVMAVLQAARARALGLSSEEAKSFGLNRALFYAAAKRGWANAKVLGIRRPVIAELDRDRSFQEEVQLIGGEKVFGFHDPRLGFRFQFGGRTQTPAEFDRKVRNRVPDWLAAWNEAVNIIKSADKKDLRSQSRFFEKVYKPRRDELAEKWSSQAKARAA